MLDNLGQKWGENAWLAFVVGVVLLAIVVVATHHLTRQMHNRLWESRAAMDRYGRWEGRLGLLLMLAVVLIVLGGGRAVMWMLQSPTP